MKIKVKNDEMLGKNNNTLHIELIKLQQENQLLKQEKQLIQDNFKIINKMLGEKIEEIKLLKIQVSSREEVANKYKEVIEEVRELLINWNYDDTEFEDDRKNINELLQILDKGESNE